MKTVLSSFLFALGVMSLSAQIPSYVPAGGLVGYWPFTGNANDITPNNYASTVFGALLTTDRFGVANRAYSFNGTSDYILTNYAGILGAGSRAVSFWAKTTQGTTQMNCVSWGNNTQGSRFGCMFNYGSIGATTEGAYCAITYSTPAPFANGQWHHYVFQFSVPVLNQVQIFQDGILLSQTTSIYNPTNSLFTVTGYSVTFGRLYVPGSPLYMNGQLDDIGIWNRTLTLCEIQQLYASSLAVSNITVTATNTLICAGQSVSLSASGATSYTWSTNSTGTAITVSPSVTTTYSVIGNGQSCGTGSNSAITISVIPQTNITVSATPVTICPGGSATLSASGAGTYTWSTNANGSQIVVSPSVTTTYSVSGAGQGCGTASSSAITVSVISQPTITVSATPVSICLGGTAILNASGAGTYTWSTNASGSQINVSPNVTTSYSVFGSTGGCLSFAYATVVITVQTLPTILAISSPSSICIGATATLMASGANTYTWSAGTSGSTLAVTPIVTSNYTVSGSAIGCTASASALVKVTVSTCENIQHYDHKEKLVISPNPSTGKVELKGTEANQEIEIFDSSGNSVLITMSMQDKTVLDLSSFSNGVYLVRIRSAKAPVQRMKLLIVK